MVKPNSRRALATIAIASLLSASVALAGSVFDTSREVALRRAQLIYININPVIQMASAYATWRRVP